MTQIDVHNRILWTLVWCRADKHKHKHVETVLLNPVLSYNLERQDEIVRYERDEDKQKRGFCVCDSKSLSKEEILFHNLQASNVPSEKSVST